MDFRTVAYLNWVKTTLRARINLCRSGVSDCKLAEAQSLPEPRFRRA